MKAVYAAALVLYRSYDKVDGQFSIDALRALFDAVEATL